MCFEHPCNNEVSDLNGSLNYMSMATLAITQHLKSSF